MFWPRDFWKGGKTQVPACSVSDKGPGLRLKQLLVFQLNPHNACSLHNPSKVRFQNVSFSRLTTTPSELLFNIDREMGQKWF